MFGISAFVISVNLWLVRPLRSSVGLMTIPWASPFFYYWRGRRVPDISNAQAIKVALK